jgi:hypothetical protein
MPAAHEWHEEGPGEYSFAQGHVSIAGDGDTVIVDVALGAKAKTGTEALRASVAAAHGAPPLLDGRIVALHFEPSALGELNFLLGLSRTVAALSGDAVPENMRDRIAAEGLWEAGQSLALARTSQGALFEGVDLGVAHDNGRFDVVARAAPGPAFAAPPDAAWAPSTSVAPAKEAGVIDVSESFARGWTLPGDDLHSLAKSKFFDSVRDSGQGGWFIALPDVAAGAARLLAKDFTRLLPAPALESESVERFERVGSFIVDHQEIAFGLLPPTTSRAAAECVLGPPRCKPDVRLPVGTVKSIAPASGTQPTSLRLVEVDGRYALLATTGDKAALAVKLVTKTVGPAVFDLRGAALEESVRVAATLLGLPIRHMAGGIERRGSDVVIDLVAE